MQSDFLRPSNVTLLCEVLSEDNSIKRQSQLIKQEIYNYIVNNIKEFYKTFQKTNLSLFDLNKIYIKRILNVVQKKFPIHNKLQISSDVIVPNNIESTELLAEDIKLSRQTKLNTDMNELQKDFDNTINCKQPELPNFAFNYENKPLQQIDMENIIAQRNYDIPFTAPPPSQTVIHANSILNTNTNDNVNSFDKKNVKWEFDKDKDTKQPLKDFFNNLTNENLINENLINDKIKQKQTNDKYEHINFEKETKYERKYKKQQQEYAELRDEYKFIRNKIDNIEERLNQIIMLSNKNQNILNHHAEKFKNVS